jgi:hypothetical protein
VEEQGQERGLLRPLLFKLPLKVGKPDNPWLTQVYVHQGDVPRELAQALTSRYSGWDKPEETVRRPAYLSSPAARAMMRTGVGIIAPPGPAPPGPRRPRRPRRPRAALLLTMTVERGVASASSSYSHSGGGCHVTWQVETITRAILDQAREVNAAAGHAPDLADTKADTEADTKADTAPTAPQ